MAPIKLNVSRKSTRVTAGVAPKSYGNPIPPIPKGNKNRKTPNPANKNTPSTNQGNGQEQTTTSSSTTRGQGGTSASQPTPPLNQGGTSTSHPPPPIHQVGTSAPPPHTNQDGSGSGTHPPSPSSQVNQINPSNNETGSELPKSNQETIDQLLSAYDEKNRLLELIALDLEEAKLKIRQNERKLQRKDMDPREEVSTKYDLEIWKGVEEELVIKHNRAKTNLRFDKRELDRKLARLNPTQVYGESATETQSTVVPRPTSPSVKSWAEEVEEEEEVPNSNDKTPQPLDNQGKGTPHPSESESKGQEQQCDLDKVMAAFLQAFNSSNKSKSGPETDVILARQVQGKDLPQFDGTPEKWPGFLAAYETTTKNCKFSNADNLPRLQKALKGDAYEKVSSQLINPDGVPEAIEMLKMLFGRPELIIESMVGKVRKLPNVKSDKPDSFVQFGFGVRNLVSMIKTLHKKDHLSNPTLITELVGKLPLMNQIDWIKSRPNETPNLEDFQTWLKAYTEAACNLRPPPSTSSTEGGRNTHRDRRDRVFSIAEGRGQRGKEKEDKCNYCGKGDHITGSCPELRKLPSRERADKVMRKGLCFGCLGSGHMFKECEFKRRCGLSGCNLDHHRLLHRQNKKNEQPKEGKKGESQEKVEEVRSTSEYTPHRSLPIINHMMVPINFITKKGPVLGYAVLDGMSTITAMQDSTRKELGVEGAPRALYVKGFNVPKKHGDSRAIDVVISPIDGGGEFQLTNVRTVKKMDLPRQSVTEDILSKWSHLRDLDIPTYDNEMPTILIGIDHPELHIQLQYRKHKNPNAPIAIRTPLGWMLMGKMSGHRSNEYTMSMREQEEDDDLHKLVTEFFKVESYGVSPTVMKPRNTEDEKAQKILDTTLRRVTDGWEVGLLWRYDDFSLPHSKNRAFSRLINMERKMDKDPQMAELYCQKIQEYITKGYARVLPKEEAAIETTKTNYIPHFMTKNPKKPTKMRFVFDAASRVQGKSLNDFLLKGPDKLRSLPGILLKFRQRRIAVTADIQDMFHRVKVKADDTQAQRFLWRGMDRDRDPDVLEMSVLIFGASCSPCCAQEAKNLNAEEFKVDFPLAAKAIIEKHYVDDYLDDFDTDNEAIQTREQVQYVHSKGNFIIRNWLSNSPVVLSSIPEELRSTTAKNMDMGTEGVVERVLGLFWRADQDVFTFSLNHLKVGQGLLEGEEVPTKRQLLSLLMSLYDPLGFLAHFTIKAKVIIQRTWICGIDWDEEIPLTLVPNWQSWMEELKEIPLFRLPRCYSLSFTRADDIQLHIFCDAGEDSFGAVCYLRVRNNDQIEVSLTMAKAKVSPLKKRSIPRLELEAAQMGAKLSEFVTAELEVKPSRVLLWSDSKTVLWWIKSDGRHFQQFVGHRIGVIQELTNVRDWRWVPTDQNPADEMTRLGRASDWSPSSVWIRGPDFLYRDPEEWPKAEEFEPEKEELEYRRQYVISCVELPPLPPLVDLSRFSRWSRMIRATAYMIRAVKLFKKKKKASTTINIKQAIKLVPSLTPEEIREAEKIHFIKAQMDCYFKEILALKEGVPIHPRSKISNLSLMLDDSGLIRYDGRINKANLPDSTKFPLLLDRKHPLTHLLLGHYHESCGHYGHQKICNEVRQSYFIPRLLTAVKQTGRDCQVCKVRKSKPVPPRMGQLPAPRLEKQPRPFVKTGLDYFGPIQVIVKRSREKRYVALFTCLSTRAIHLEVTHSLTTDSCIQAIRRFAARRGNPSELHSDNGTNLHGANNELKSALNELNQDKIQDECTNKGIKWVFIPPSAPHMGGSWERLVRSTKEALGAVLNMKTLHDEPLLTFITEAEHTVNSHPLTHVTDDPNDDEALTPNHFLIGRSSNLQPICLSSEDDLWGRKQWRIIQQLAEQFWKRWVKEFLPTLLRRDKWNQITRPIKEGDVIIEVNPDLPRNTWPKGRVLKLYPGPDGIVRVVDIKLGNGHTYRRPVSKLCILDVEQTAARG